MIKIDLHIHTIAAESDECFEFSIEKLKEYVSSASIDAIALTNHNIFDIQQYLEISLELDIKVYPGIEINFEKGHLLLIADGSDIDDFEEECQKVTNAIPSASDGIDIDTLNAIFPCLERYILIPHYDKKPKVPDSVIDKLSGYITAGEVGSIKKFMYSKKDGSSLVPVYFSDSRISKDLIEMPTRYTYLNCDDAEFASIKNCLTDKNKVALSADETGRLFEIFEDGQQLFSGLNVVLGERSSGKTYTLDRIEETFPNVCYLKQFSLVEKNEENEEKKFNQLLSEKHSLLTREYLGEFQTVVNDVIDVDLSSDEDRVEKYVESLLKYAKELERHDSYSKACLFSEEKYQLSPQKGLQELIASTINLIENMEFRDLIEEHLSIISLKKLVVGLMEEYSSREQERLKRRWVNGVVGDVKSKLNARSASDPIDEINLYDVALNVEKIKRFNEIVNNMKHERIIQKKSLQGFEVVAETKVFDGALALQKTNKSKKIFSSAYAKYDEPYEFLQKLKLIEGLEEADYYKYFVKVEYKILNKDGYKVSGGERSEFNLLQKLENAQKHDMLLIDEPESSFDNLFLKTEVNQLLREISKNMPVVIVTHNSTVGASIKPDYILYTKKEIFSGGIKRTLYSGFPTDKELVSASGDRISNHTVTIGCLEAGEEAYNERRSGYENLRD